ncbi:MAG: exodeoxyribonuclease VII small subunit [Desulfobacterales bacterium]|nr:exodeoxyribonuclease VII small subunit [Desulfobacterales bacterium]
MASKNFEESLRDLEKIVKDLEKGDLPLEKALKRFEDGMALSKRCSRMLDETEQKISQLIKDSDGTLTEQEFAAPTPDRTSPSAPE